MFDHRHYVPILKGKLAEYNALNELAPASKAALTPLLEIPSIPWDYKNDAPAETVDEHIGDVPQHIRTVWGTTRPLFLDAEAVADAGQLAGGLHPLAGIAENARTASVQLIPVTGLQRDADYQTAVAAIVARDRRGVCIRLENEDFEDLTALHQAPQDLLGVLGVGPNDTDMIIDLKAFKPDQVTAFVIAARSMLGALPNPASWRTLTVAGSSFPQDLRAFAPDSMSVIPRSEWALWAELVGKPRVLSRLPTFGDYAIQHPEPEEIDPRVMRMTANLRYTLDKDWLILKGRDTRRHGFAQFNDLCRKLVARHEFRSAPHCRGCGYIDRCAGNTDGPGNATTWRRVGTVHHLTVVTEQLASLP